MLSALLFVITLLLTYWLISLVWSQKVAKCVFKFFIYIGLIVAIILAIYVGYQGYRWGALLHQLNERSLDTTKIISSPSLEAPLPPAQQN